jgi:predicted AlkP superfamily phosphohydrolase/phosphomutase
LVISDHGFGPLFYNIYLNCWLYEHGYLVLKRNVTTLLKRLAWRAGLTPENLYVWAERLRLLDLGASLRHGHLHDLLGRVFLSTQNIDWPRTRAYSYGNVGQIYLNLKGREPQGCVEPAELQTSHRRDYREATRLEKAYNPLAARHASPGLARAWSIARRRSTGARRSIVLRRFLLSHRTGSWP